MAAAGAEVFQRCVACHEAASLTRFACSDAPRSSGIVWTDDNLRKWVADDTKLVPGTRMWHVAITDTAEQDYLIVYLKNALTTRSLSH